MNNAIDITLENTGVVMEVENFDTENNTILVSLSRNGVDADVDSVAPSITVDFGSLPQNVYWDEIQDKPDFHPVATSGDYDDLENKPNLHQVATTGDYQDLENKPNLSEVATSGDYEDLDNLPSINNVELIGNKTAAQLGLQTELTIDATPTANSTNPVQSGGVFDALADKPAKISVEGIDNLTAAELASLEGGDVVLDIIPRIPKAYIVMSSEAGITILANINTVGIEVVSYHSDAYQSTETLTYDSLIKKPTRWNGGLLLTYNQDGNIAESGIDEDDVATTSDLAGKQDTISDLDDIRSGAALGATSVQSSEKGAASGVATLDSGGKVPQSQLPSYVDDVLEYANLASFPATGESGKIYVALDTNKTYRWSGSAYVEISQGLALGETSSTAFPGDRGKAIEDKIPSSASSSNKLATASDVNGKLSAPSTAGTSGQVLTSDGQGGQSWQTPQSGGTATDVQVNGTSITSNNVANIVTNTAYNASSNKIATMSDLPSVPVTDVTVGGTSVVSSGTAVIPAIPDVTGKADKVSNATSGNFASLDSNGNLADSGHKHSDYLTSHQDISGKADKVSSATSGNFAGLDSNGNLTDSGSKASDFATAAQGALADSSIQGVSVNGTALTPSSGVVNVSVPTETSDLTNDSGFVNTATDELLNYYKKSQTYSQAEVDALLASVNTFEYVSVDTLPTASSSTMGKVYIYNGHRYITEEDNGSYSWTDLGSYDIDLSGYVTTTTLNTALENRPVFQEVTETQMQNLLDNENWEQGVLYYTVEQEEE